MTIQTIDKIDMLDFEDLSTIVGGACSFLGATAAVGVGGAVKGGITYGLTCRY